MKSLEKIQKIFRVILKIVKVFTILSIIGAAIYGLFAIFALSEHYGGKVFSIFGEEVSIFKDEPNLLVKFNELISSSLILISDIILLVFASSYLKTEIAEGTPFGEKGPEKLKKLGIRSIYIPIIAFTVAEIIVLITLGEDSSFSIESSFSVITGIVLIIVSIIFKYGKELEVKAKNQETPDSLGSNEENNRN